MITAVDFLREKLTSVFINDKAYQDLFNQAKEMELQQTIDIVKKSRETGLTAEYLLLQYQTKPPLENATF